MLLPLPIPEAAPSDDVVDLHYMALQETLNMPFKNKYQSCKIARARVEASKNSLAASNSFSSIGVGRGRRRGRGAWRCRVARFAKDVSSLVSFQTLKSVTRRVKRENFSMAGTHKKPTRRGVLHGFPKTEMHIFVAIDCKDEATWRAHKGGGY